MRGLAKWWQARSSTERLRYIVLVVFFLGAVLSLTLGVLTARIFSWSDFFLNLSTELAGAGLTFLLIDFFLNRRQHEEEQRQQEQKARKDQERKRQSLAIRREHQRRRLMMDLGSDDRATVLNAWRVLKDRGWLTEDLLSEQDFTKANWEGIEFTEMNLQNTRLASTNMRSANLRSSRLNGSDLGNADLTEASMWNVNLRKADLSYATLTDADLYEADLTGANLTGCKLINTNLYDAELGGANLQFANLTGAILVNADFTEAILTDATLPDGKKYRSPDDLIPFVQPNQALGEIAVSSSLTESDTQPTRRVSFRED